MLREGPVGSWNLSGRPWWLLVAPGVNICENDSFKQQNQYFSFPRAILNVSQEVYSGSFKMHEDYRFVDFWIQGQKTIKSSLMGLVLMTWHNITSGEHLIIGSSFIGSLARGSPVYSPNHWGAHKKYVSTQKYFYYILSAAAVTSHTLLLPAESALHEV